MNLGFDLKEWDSVEAIEMGGFERLKLGGHVVDIKSAELYTSERTGNTSLKVCVDIAKDDEQAGYFQKQFDENPNAEKNWSNGATKYLSLKKESLAYTKGFISALEKSNKGFMFSTQKGWEQLVGLKCVGVFGLEEYEKQDGSIGTATRLTQFRSIDKLKDVKIPKVKMLNGDTVGYNEYIDRINDLANASQVETSAVEINPDDMPF